MPRAKPNESLLKLPGRVLQPTRIINAPNVGQLHAEGVEYIVIALRQEAAFLAAKSAHGYRLSKRESRMLGNLAMALALLGKGVVQHAQAMLAAARDGDG